MFVSSPFISNYVIQYHLSAHSSDLTSSLIRDKFYVDNLIITCNNDVMLSQYVDSIRKLMLEGGLPLREWVSLCFRSTFYGGEIFLESCESFRSFL